MSFREQAREKNELYKERLELVTERLSEISKQQEVEAPFADFFKTVADTVLFELSIFEGRVDKKAAVEKFYAEISGDNYENNYANPTYAVKTLGADYGQYLCDIYRKVRNRFSDVYEESLERLCMDAELVVEVYNYFENKDELSAKAIKDVIYSYEFDNCELFSDYAFAKAITADYDPFMDLVMQGDFSNPEYLYEYGLNVSSDSVETAAYLDKCSEEEIQAMADTFTEGYRLGFIACNKDLSKKHAVDVRYQIGFERMVRAIVKNFEKLDLRSILRPSDTPANKQYDYDSKEMSALYCDKALVEHGLEGDRNALEKIKDVAAVYGGPAVIEVFGEEPFSPEQKPESPKFDDEQQKLQVYYMSQVGQMIHKYIHGEDRNFTIIAYPVASIGDQYEEIFAETVKLNTLDYIKYRDIQQTIINSLDKADRVHVVGANGNKTDIYIKIFDLKNPEKETAFENCVADVNIPVGEVFTSPVLEGTEGKLHVTQVYLNELNYLNLEIDFKNGMVDQYTCTNFEEEDKNKKYIEDNLLFHHPTLPIGEFAIGTNTTAYKMARVYDIAAKMPILIAEKTGPHFAIGDTCYTHDEDNVTYNSDGKAIVARENSISALRHTDMSKAYFNCHTDITIPYDELGAITVLRKDGSTEDIIRDGKFVLAGTEELNIPLIEYDEMK